MTTDPVILLVGTADAKSDELAFLRESLQALGGQVLLMDVGVLATGHVQASARPSCPTSSTSSTAAACASACLYWGPSSA